MLLVCYMSTVSAQNSPYANAAVGAAADVVEVDKFQPAIVQQHAPNIQHRWSIDGNQQRTGVARFASIVPSYNGKGNLIASWNPRSGRVAERPTFIVVHGGHGVSPGFWRV